MENNHVSVLEIDLKALEYNVNYFKSKLLPSTKILAVVKAFGYGSDAQKIAFFLNDKVHYFAVAYFDEGLALRNAGITKPILVLHPQKANLNKLTAYQLEPNIYSFTILSSFIEILQKEKITNYPVHFKFNTGLNRLGFKLHDIDKISEILRSTSTIKAASIFSHIAASEDLNEREFTLQQINAFKTIAKSFVEKTKTSPFKHMLNTSGIINYNQQAQFDMARLGIGMYGFGNDADETAQLKNVLTLKSVISQIHTIEKGESVGYNRAYVAHKQIKTATIPIGHADGISRQLGKGIGYFYINNQKVYIIGNVCMDMVMVDVSDINCNEGDEVIIYKNQEHIENLAKLSNTISYELLTAISQRVKRLLKNC